MRHMSTAELTKQPPDCTECPYRVDSSVLVKKVLVHDIAFNLQVSVLTAAALAKVSCVHLFEVQCCHAVY